MYSISADWATCENGKMEIYLCCDYGWDECGRAFDLNEKVGHDEPVKLRSSLLRAWDKIHGEWVYRTM